MIKKKQQFVMGDVTFTVDPKKPFVTMQLGDQKRSIKKNELWLMVFAISNSKKQADLIPVVEREMMQFKKQHMAKLTRDMKAGEDFIVNCLVDIPMTVVQANLTPQQIADAMTIIENDKVKQEAITSSMNKIGV